MLFERSKKRLCSIFSIDPLPRLAIEKKYLSVNRYLGGGVVMCVPGKFVRHCTNIRRKILSSNLPVEDTSGVYKYMYTYIFLKKIRSYSYKLPGSP